MAEAVPYNIINPSVSRLPIVVSVPHCGTAFPDEIKDEYHPHLIASPDDTDWFVDKLYDFAPSMGITMITAKYSRWVIDLNRDPQSKPLYTDGRIITALCPTTTFLGEPIYKDNRSEVQADEMTRRLDIYYHPYHRKIQEILDDLKSKFGKVLLWDCHSIRQYVPTIQQDKFPDLILGSADERSASPELIRSALDTLRTGPFVLNHNHPFKGGYITRFFGKPEEHQHALQLEMCKIRYMDDTETCYDEKRATVVRDLLKATFESLAERLAR